MIGELPHWIADGLVIIGCLVMTLGVVGVLRLPDVYSKLHAASKSVFLGVCSILAAAAALGDGSIASRAILIFVLLLMTTPVSAHEMARSAALEGDQSAGLSAGLPVPAPEKEQPKPTLPSSPYRATGAGQ